VLATTEQLVVREMVHHQLQDQQLQVQQQHQVQVPSSSCQVPSTALLVQQVVQAKGKGVRLHQSQRYENCLFT